MSFIQQFFTSRDNNANAATFVGQEGRLWWDPITNQIYSSDGNTPGGIPLSGGGGNGSPGGANSQVQFNQNGNFGGSALLTFDRVTGELTANSYAGGSMSLSGNISANYVTAENVGNTGNLEVQSGSTYWYFNTNNTFTGTGNITAGYYFGNGSQLTGITSSYGNSNVVTLLSSFDGNPISTTGNVSAGYFLGNGSQLTGIVSTSANTANYALTANTANTAITVTANAQPNITSLGNLINVQFNTSVTPITAATGQMFWDTGEHTITLGMEKGVQQQIGLEQYMYIKANAAISDGQVVMFAGSSGDNLLGVPADTTTPGFRPEYIMGIATQDIARNGFGYVTTFGLVHGLNTLAFAVGDILWVDNATPGALTNTQPSDPNFQIQMAAVTKRAGGDGHIMVRPTPFYDINRVTNVNTTTPITGQVLTYNGANAVWINANSYGNTNVVTLLSSFDGNPISTTGNITGGNFIGNGSQLTGLSSANVGNANYATTAGSTTQLVNGSSTVALYSDGTMSFPSGLINTSSNTIGLWSTNSTSLTWRTPTATTAGQPFQSILTLSNAGISITALAGNVSNLTTKTWGFAYNGNLLFPDSTVQTTAFTGTAATVTTNAQPNITSVGTLTSVSSTGNITGANLLTGGTIYVTSSAAGAGEIKFSGATELANIITVGAIGNTLTGNGSINILTGSAAGGNIGFYVAQSERGRFTSTGLSVTGNASASGNITGGNLLTAGLISATGNITSAANIAGGNLISVGQVIAGNGSITQPGFRFAGDNDTGLYLTGDGNLAVVTNAGIRILVNDSGANITGSLNLTSGLSATGNLTAGNLLTNGIVSAASHIGSIVSVTANVTGGNIVGTHVGNLTGTTASLTGNVTGGNIITGGLISATGTITSNGGTNSTAFAVGNSAVSNVALGLFPTAGTPGEYAIRDYSTVTTNMYFDVGVGGTANGQFIFRTTNSYSTLATVNIYGITLTTNRPAFRVTGSGTTNNLTTTQNGTGALNGNNWAADYTQGSGLNSTTGVFTAPVAGLYQINVVGRNSGYAGGISQLAVVKNATGGTGAGGTVACMIEWAASSSMNHVGSGTVARLAVNDTLALKVLAGQINFDSNDNWSIAYLG